MYYVRLFLLHKNNETFEKCFDFTNISKVVHQRKFKTHLCQAKKKQN